MDGTNPIESANAYAPENHPLIKAPKVGVLLVNLGTPDAAEPGAVRRYLAEFLSDPRIVEIPRILWLPILHGVILNTRPAATAKNYAKIWRAQSDESPLRYYTREQALSVAEAFGDAMVVDWAMRYGNPSIRDRLEAMKSEGCERIVILPLYPQYSATTTASVTDAVFDAIKSMRWQPAIRIAPPFHDDDLYIDGLAATAQEAINTLNWTPQRVILSFHGLPERYFKAGDPYHCHCQKTARLLREKMAWAEDFAPLAFQSKFGRDKWLEPATDDTIEQLAESGVKNLAVITPGFVSDCIETLEEIDIAGRESFINAGGKEFALIPCLNDSEHAQRLFTAIARRETAGWL